MKRRRIIWLLTVMFVVQATFPYFMNGTVDAASSTHLGSKNTSFSHFEDDPGGWAKGGNGNYLQIGGTFIRADVNQLRANWHQALAKDVKLGGIGLDSPTDYTPPTGYKIHSYASYAVYNMRTYDVQKENSGCDGGTPTDNKCNPYYFSGDAGEDNRWAKSPNISSPVHWVYYTTDIRYNAGLKKDMEYYRWRTAQIRKQGSNNGAGGTPWLKYDFKIVPISSPTPPDTGGGGETDPNPEPEPEPEPNKPPRVTIDGPTIVMAGEEFCLNAYGVDDDGYVDAYLWSPVQSERNSDILCTSYPTTGTKEISVIAIDDQVATSDPAYHHITVIAPNPSADFSVQGALKENRKVQLRTVHPYGERKGVIEAFPMVEEKWTITAMNPANQEQIKTHLNLAEDISYDKLIDVLMKVQGDYKVRRHVKNSLDLEDTVEKIISIKPDYLPVADFDVVTQTFRNNILLKPGQSTATIKITDKSYSNDDFIQQRIWSYYYDSNNDGSYLDETEVVVSKDNETSMNISNLPKVGNYLIQLKVIEEFGQETIDEFVVPEDRRRHDVMTAQTELSIPVKPVADRTVKIDNLAPNATFDVYKKGSDGNGGMDLSKVDIQIALDKTSYSPAVVESAMATVRSRLNGENIQADISVKEIKKPYKIVDMFSQGDMSWASLLVSLDSGDVYAAGYNPLNGFDVQNYVRDVPYFDASTEKSFVKLPKYWGNDFITKIESNVNNFYNLVTSSGDVIRIGKGYSGDDTLHGQSVLNRHRDTFGDNRAVDYSNTLYNHFIVLNNGKVYGKDNETSSHIIYNYYKVNDSWGTNKIKQISVGMNHILYLDETGTPYASGKSPEGALGLGYTNSVPLYNPIAIPKVWGNQKITKVLTETAVSYFLTENGDVYASGAYYNGALGVQTSSNLRTPTLVHKSWGSEKVIDIAMSNANNGYFLTDSGNVYATGQNTVGTFGDVLAVGAKTTIPVKMTNSWGNQKIVKIKASGMNLLLLTEKNDLYISGQNNGGQFANGTTSTTPPPNPVKISQPWNDGRGENPFSKPTSDMSFGVVFGQEALEEEEVTSIPNKMLEYNSDLIGVGTNKSQAQMNSMIARNLNRGLFIQDNNDINSIANQLADYIIAKINKKKTEKEIYLTLEEEAEYKINYRDEENDSLLAEKWKFNHTPNVFENDMGIDYRHMTDMAAPIQKFAKVGLYKPVLSVKDEPVFWGDNRFEEYRKWSSPYDEWNVYVHRKPIPEFSFSIGIDRSYTIKNEAFDLDKYSVNIGYGPGIRTQKWEWRELNTTAWQPGLPPNPLANKVYEVKNTVVDFQNREESLIKIMNGSGVNVPPIPLFELIEQVEVGVPVKPTDMSYDPNGDPIREWRWWIKKLNPGDTDPTQDAGFVLFATGTEKEPSMNFDSSGTFVVRLQVQDMPGLWSDDPNKYAYQTIEVFSANEPPVACMKIPTPNFIGDTIFIENCASDVDNDSLTYVYTVKKQNGETLVINSGNSQIDASGNLTLIANQYPTDLGVWDIRQEVSDGTEIAQTEGKLTVLDQTVEGNVQHTMKWLDNLTKYNADYPFKAFNLDPANGLVEFLPGEKFILQGNETEEAVQVNVHIKEYPLVYDSVTLTEDATNIWTGSMWKSDMISRFKNGEILTFVFTATFSNGWVDADEVQIQMKDDPYWRQHTTF